MKRYLVFFLIVILMLSLPLAVFAEGETDAEAIVLPDELIDQKPVFNDEKADAEALLLIDAKSGFVLHTKNANQTIFPASITKILTCLIALDETEMSDLVTCGQEVVFPPEYAVIGLKPGEIITVRDLIYGIMLESGNDAAAALAVYMGGSIDGFAAMMNKKAEQLGMDHSHFVNPYGGHHDNHFSTAEDMARLAMVAYNNPDFMTIVGTNVYQPAETNMPPARKLMDNTNRLIRDDVKSFAKWYNDYATGMKTGYTSKAGYCLVASTSKDGQDLIVLIFNHDDNSARFTLANQLFTFGYDNYKHVDLLNILGDSIIRESISNATDDDPNGGFMEFIPNIEANTYFTDANIFIDTMLKNTNDINVMVDLDADLRAPILKGETYGKVIYQYRDRILLRSELVAAYDMLNYATDYLTFQEEDPNVVIAPPKDLNSGTVPQWWWMIFPSLLILMIVYRLLTYNRSRVKRIKNPHDYDSYQ